MTNQEQLDSLSNFFQIILVNSSEGRLETSEVIKEKKSFKTITKYNDYKLKKLDCNHSLFFNILQEIKTPNNFEESEIRFVKYKLNFFQRLFLRNRNKIILNKIKDMSESCSWSIIPNSIFELIKKIPGFVRISSLNDKIYLGHSDKVHFYLNPDVSCEEVYFGNYDSFKLIINKNNFDFELIDKSKIKILNLF